MALNRLKVEIQKRADSREGNHAPHKQYGCKQNHACIQSAFPGNPHRIWHRPDQQQARYEKQHHHIKIAVR